MRTLAFFILIVLLTGAAWLFGELAAGAPVPPQVQGGSPIRVAIIDSGLGPWSTDVPLCASGHANFADGSPTDISDSHIRAHGSNVASLITRNAGATKWCAIIIKIFNSDNKLPSWPAYFAALKYVISLHPDVANLSFGGSVADPMEGALLTELSQHTKLFIAAGNESLYLGVHNCKWWPACYRGLKGAIIVGNLGGQTSNWGPRVTLQIPGNDLNAGGSIMSGTSQSTAVATGQYLATLKRAAN